MDGVGFGYCGLFWVRLILLHATETARPIFSPFRKTILLKEINPKSSKLIFHYLQWYICIIYKDIKLLIPDTGVTRNFDCERLKIEKIL